MLFKTLCYAFSLQLEQFIDEFRITIISSVISCIKELFCYSSKAWSEYNYLGFAPSKTRFLCLGSSNWADWAFAV
jgi:hypothetical protein